MSKLIDRWFVKIDGSIYMLFFYSNLIYFTRWDDCHGHPIFLYYIDCGYLLNSVNTFVCHKYFLYICTVIIFKCYAERI